MKTKWTASLVLTLAMVGSTAAALAASAPSASEWDKTVAAAKREGQLVMLAPAGRDIRAGFIQEFQRKYPEIVVEYSGVQGAQLSPKLLTEQAAGLYSTDLVIAGASTILEALLPANTLVPIQPYLTGPESRDLSKWRGGKFNFSDSAEKYNLVYGERVQVAFIYNPEVVQANKFKSWRDLLNPEWKGKIAMINPRRAGAGVDISTFWFINESAGLGKPYMRELLTTQETAISNEERHLVESVARGKYLLAIGPSGTMAFEFRKKGMPIELFGSAAFREGGFVVASNGTVAALKNTPHPNATKVYLNYLLSREGQTHWSRASGLTSRRLDVPRDHVPEILVPKVGTKYLELYREQNVVLREQMVAYLDSILSR